MKDKVLSQEITAKAADIGFAGCGIISAAPFSQFLAKLRARMEKYPHAAGLYEPLASNAFPQEKRADCSSIVVCISRYGQFAIPADVDTFVGRLYLFDGRLDWSPQSQRRKDFEQFLSECGLSWSRDGVPARWAAVRAGLGRFGRNNFLYTRHGSWVVVETWLVDRCLDPTAGEGELEDTACPEGCSACIDACPTGALSAPFSMDWSRCIAHLTYRGPVPSPLYLRGRMGSWLYGCDDCQLACPQNEGRWEEAESFPRLEEAVPYLNPRGILGLSERQFETVIYPRFFYSDDLGRWQANAVRAMGFSGSREYLPQLKAACSHPDRRVRRTALWARERLAAPGR